jgi:hypothetical protein
MGPDGAVVVAQNTPVITDRGDFHQDSIQRLYLQVGRCLDQRDDQKITDIRLEELPLEGDYYVRAYPEQMTDEGIAYALAAILRWKTPKGDHDIVYQPDKGLRYIDSEGRVKEWNPVQDLCTCMAIILKARVPVRWDEKTGDLLVGPGGCMPRPITGENNIRRELMGTAINSAMAWTSDSAWDGNVRLSMIRTTPPTDMGAE